MRAVRIHSHGGPEVLQVDQIPEPTPGPGDLLVRLRATSVNHRDVWIRRGHPHPAYHVDLPAVLGIDVCGDVVEVGSEADGFRPGDRVTASPYMQCGVCRYCARGSFQLCPSFAVYHGTYAELFLVPAQFAVTVDPSVPDEHVAAFPNAYITAWQMLVGTPPTRSLCGRARVGSAAPQSRSRSCTAPACSRAPARRRSGRFCAVAVRTRCSTTIRRSSSSACSS
jgi:NADPH:quinone reductase-like Zn-dependent oxidoreductase